MIRMKLGFTLYILAIFFASANSSSAQTLHDRQPLKVGFVIDGPVFDYGYNYAHNLGRLYLQSHLPNAQTISAENIPENAEAERIMEKMIAQGGRLIFLTSYGYLEPAERVAKRHSEVIFMQSWQTSQQKNIGTYGAYQFEKKITFWYLVLTLTYMNWHRKNGLPARNGTGAVYTQELPNLFKTALGKKTAAGWV